MRDGMSESVNAGLRLYEPPQIGWDEVERLELGPRLAEVKDHLSLDRITQLVAGMTIAGSLFVAGVITGMLAATILF